MLCHLGIPLIEPYWNVNIFGNDKHLLLKEAFNRTILECKFKIDSGRSEPYYLPLIEPYWNVNPFLSSFVFH